MIEKIVNATKEQSDDTCISHLHSCNIIKIIRNISQIKYTELTKVSYPFSCSADSML